MRSLKLRFSYFTFLPLLIVLGCSQNPDESLSLGETDSQPIEIEEVSERYGIPEASFRIYDGVIKKNQFLADILLSYGVPYGSIAALENVAKDVYDVRKLRQGDPYAMFCTKDSTEAACYFVVETSPETYVVYQLTDSISAYIGKKPVVTKIREVGGVINSSLSQTIAENDLSPNLANKLSDIYAWTVDFYRIQRGDYFKVIFEEVFVDDKSIGIGHILAAEFYTATRRFTAIALCKTALQTFLMKMEKACERHF